MLKICKKKKLENNMRNFIGKKYGKFWVRKVEFFFTFSTFWVPKVENVHQKNSKINLEIHLIVKLKIYEIQKLS